MEPSAIPGSEVCAQHAAVSLTAPIWQDVLAQAVTGELIASLNYDALAKICTDPEEAAEALEHAESERGHAAAFRAEARKLGVEAVDNLEGRYWKRLRGGFLGCIIRSDIIGCLIVQEVMLESFAVASYDRVGRVGPGSLGETFAAIAREEAEHIDHAMTILRTERARDQQKFDDKVYRLHLEVMTALAEMTAKECRSGHCEVCHSDCAKPALPSLGLTTSELRGASLQQYLKTLDALGLPGETTLGWVMRLPV